MPLTAVYSAIDRVANVVNYIKNNITSYYTDNSLVESTKLTRVEPLLIVSRDVMNLDYAPDVSNSMLSIFSGYYLQAISMLSSVNNVEVIRILDRLNPDRDSSGWLLSEYSSSSMESASTLSMESYKYSLPMALEAKTGVRDQPRGSDSKVFETNLKESINAMSNMSVGKLLNVEIGVETPQGAAVVNVPVNVRLNANTIPNDTILQIIAGRSEDRSLVERFHAWRSGRISFIRDLIFAQDLIDESKRAHMKDETNTIDEIMRRVNNSKKFGLLTKNPSLVSASNLFIISEEVARNVEQKLNGKLSNKRVREQAFSNTYAMVIAVVDRDYERVTFYTRGIDASTDVSVRELKAANKTKDSTDIADILKQITSGQAPSF